MFNPASLLAQPPRAGMIAGAPVAEDRAMALWGLVATRAAAEGRRVSVADVCVAAVTAAGVSGAWMNASGGAGPDFVLCVTGPVAERLAELQLTLGEGPCHDVLATAAPVLAPDLGDEYFTRRWPAFAAEARRVGAEAVFAFPLTVGAVRAGVMGLYRSTPGPLKGTQFGDGLLLADAGTVLLLDSTGHGGDGDGLGGQTRDLALHRAEVDQATGMLTEQLGVPAAEAFARLRAYAYASDRRLTEVAADIVARRLRLSADLSPDGIP